MDQSTNTVVMIRPIIFTRNEQTAVNNYFQQTDALAFGDSTIAALREFDDLANKMKLNGINVVVWQDNPVPYTPDSLFPNNWVSFHEDNSIFLYPMFAVNRRLERITDLKSRISNEGFYIEDIIDISYLENSGIYLEGTGSLVLDRVNKLAYAALSDRTHSEALDLWSKKSGYEVVRFHAFHDSNGARKPVYHTNVVMSICSEIAIICLESIDDLGERNMVKSRLEQFREVLEISQEQVNEFAGNMLEVKNSKEEKFLVMSERAYRSLSMEQLDILRKKLQILHSPLETIENLGGGSARCMIAEVFLTSK
jgi:hypothetical protein